MPGLDLAINTGLRKSSQYGLTWDMVDWKSRELHIPRTKNEEPLHLPLNDAAIAAMKIAYARGDGKGAPLEDIADLLGHKSLTMARRYAHLDPNKLHVVGSLLEPSATRCATSENGVVVTTSQVAAQ